jgi:hypothetical protein
LFAGRPTEALGAVYADEQTVFKLVHDRSPKEQSQPLRARAAAGSFTVLSELDERRFLMLVSPA